MSSSSKRRVAAVTAKPDHTIQSDRTSGNTRPSSRGVPDRMLLVRLAAAGKPAVFLWMHQINSLNWYYAKVFSVGCFTQSFSSSYRDTNDLI